MVLLSRSARRVTNPRWFGVIDLSQRMDSGLMFFFFNWILTEIDERSIINQLPTLSIEIEIFTNQRQPIWCFQWVRKTENICLLAITPHDVKKVTSKVSYCIDCFSHFNGFFSFQWSASCTIHRHILPLSRRIDHCCSCCLTLCDLADKYASVESSSSVDIGRLSSTLSNTM